jgi:hypothetical protein
VFHILKKSTALISKCGVLWQLPASASAIGAVGTIRPIRISTVVGSESLVVAVRQILGGTHAHATIVASEANGSAVVVIAGCSVQSVKIYHFVFLLFVRLVSVMIKIK